MHHCLNKNELSELIEMKMSGRFVTNEGLAAWIDYADNWQEELCVLAYLLCCIIETKVEAGQDCQSIIDIVYRLPETMLLQVQEFDPPFVEFMLRNLRQKNSLSLEEEIIDLQSKLSQFAYEKTIRY